MPDVDRVKYSDINNPAVAGDIANGSRIALAIIDAQTETGYASTVATILEIGRKINGNIVYDTELGNKTVFGAIKELRGLWLTGTLTAGQTSLVLSNEAITTDSTVYGVFVPDTFYGVNPTGVTVATGSVTLTFPQQASDLPVKVQVF